MIINWFKRQWLALNRRVGHMRKTAIRDQLYGGIIEMMKNREFFYRSEIGRAHEYSNWTDQGKEELMDFIMAHSKKMLVAEEAEIDALAREMTFSALKKVNQEK